jgi:hypothetical protein
MRFFIIDPADFSIREVHCEKLEEVLKQAGLEIMRTEFQTVYTEERWGLQIAYYETGLLEPPNGQHRFFSIGPQLFAGSVVAFAFSRPEGDTMSIPKEIDLPAVMFYRSHLEVEAAIQRDEIERPQILINGSVVWEWNRSRNEG